MTRASAARRYWGLLTGAVTGPVAADPRERAGYSFWERYWASFTLTSLPAKRVPTTGTAAGARPVPLRPPQDGPPAPVPRSASWFPLPPVPATATLMAGDDDNVVVAATSPNRVEFFVRRHGTSARYRIEVVIRDRGMLPAVVAIRYPTAHGQRLLLVPVVAGPFVVAASQAELPGLEQEAPWEAAEPVPFGKVPGQGWDGDVVASSVAAAVSQATRAAWGALRDAADDDLAAVINQAL